MTFLVPFDGSALSEAALVRAVEFGYTLDERVLATTVVPDGNADYARERDWLDAGAAFDRDAVVAAVHDRVTDLAPEADFRHELVGQYAPTGEIARTVREVARDEDAAIVFLGSENAGQIVSGVGSVGASVAAEDSYDVHIVRHRSPSKVQRVAETSPHVPSKSDFYPVD